MITFKVGMSSYKYIYIVFKAFCLCVLFVWVWITIKLWCQNNCFYPPQGYDTRGTFGGIYPRTRAVLKITSASSPLMALEASGNESGGILKNFDDYS